MREAENTDDLLTMVKLRIERAQQDPSNATHLAIAVELLEAHATPTADADERAREVLERVATEHGYTSLNWQSAPWQIALAAMRQYADEAVARERERERERQKEAKPSWRIAGVGSHFGPIVVVDGVPHDMIVMMDWSNQLRPRRLGLPGHGYVKTLLAMMDEAKCREIAIQPVRHQERVSITRDQLESALAAAIRSAPHD